MPEISSEPLRAKIAARGTVEPARIPGIDSLTMTVSIVVIVAALYFARDALIPVALAIILSFILGPLVGLLRRIGAGHVTSVLAASVGALAVLLLLAGLIGTQAASLAGEIPLYQTTLEHKADILRKATIGRLSLAMKQLGQAARQASAAAVPAPASNSASPAVPPPLSVEVHQPAPTPMDVAERYLTPVLSPIASFGLIFVVAVFILLQKEDLRDRLIRLFGSSDLHRTTVAMDDAARRLSKYFVTQLTVNVCFGTVIGVGLLLIGIPSPLLWGVLAALMRFVPYVGSVISVVPPLILAGGVDPTWTSAIWVAALFVLTEFVTGQAIEPMVYGHTTGLSPVSIVVGAIFWTWIWGPVGLILATPLTLCLVVLGRHVQRLEFLDVLLGDRPALTPVQSFYQRMLAGDPDEVAGYAELLLKDRSLSSYYDEVVLKGLQLAAVDAARGALTDQRLDRLRSSLTDLLDTLDEHTDADPPAHGKDDGAVGPSKAEKALPAHPAPPELPIAPAWRIPAPVLCIAGRGPLDDGAAAVLSQLLHKHGLGTQSVSQEQVAPGYLRQLDLGGVRMACLTYLDVSGSPPALRVLIRRLRRRLPPGTPVLVGLWADADPALKDEAIRREMGADIYVSTLRDAVQACLHQAQSAEEPLPLSA